VRRPIAVVTLKNMLLPRPATKQALKLDAHLAKLDAVELTGGRVIRRSRANVEGEARLDD
jgi:hypothetical protein